MSLITELWTFVWFNSEWSRQFVVYIAFCIYIIASTMYYLPGASASYLVARCMGALLKWALVPSIIPPISSSLFTWLRNSSVGHYFGLDRRLDDHRLFGQAIFIASLIHAMAHYLYNPANFTRQAGWTGLAMLASFAVMLSGVFLKRYKYFTDRFSYSTLFILPHRWGAILFLAAYSVHTPDGRLIKFGGSVVGFYLFDRLIQTWYRTQHTTIISATVVQGDVAHAKADTIILRVRRLPGMAAWLPGQAAALIFKAINDTWHWFTIVNSFPGETNTDGKVEPYLEFHIKACGDWTKKLLEQTKVNSGVGLKITVIGPIGSSLLHFNTYPKFTYIATGIGYTPISAYLNYCFRERLVLPRLDIHLSNSWAKNFVPFLKVLAHCNEENRDRLDIHFYYTAKDTEATQDLAELQALVDQMALKITIHPRQAHLENIVASAQVLGVCGAAMVMKQVSFLASMYGKRCFVESF